MSKKGLYSTAGAQDNDFNLFPPQIIRKSNLDELREKLALWKWGGNAHKYLHGDSVSEASERAIAEIDDVMQLFSHHLEQETKQLINEIADMHATQPYQSFRDWLYARHLPTANKSKEK